MTELFRNDFGKVSLQNNYVIVEYKDFLPFKRFKELSEKALSVIEEKKTNKFLAETGHMKSLEDETEKWKAEIWFPQAQEAGLKFVAFVIPNNVFGRMSLDAIKSNKINGLVMQKFRTVDEAKEWLANCE